MTSAGTARTGPLVLRTFGSFTVGGRRAEIQGRAPVVVALSADLPDYLVDPNGTYAIEHAYVQYFVPEPAEELPVVFVHGGGMTGTCWETAPDGREGWLQFVLRADHPAYVLDNVERGRAGWSPVPGLRPESPALLRTEQEAWDAFRIGPPDGYATRTPYPGSEFPCEHLAELARNQVPRWTTTTELSVDAVVALIQRIGRCAVIAHSQGGGIAARAVEACGDLVESLVLIEPHGLPAADDMAGSTNCRRMIVAGDFIDLSPMYRDLRRRWDAYLAAVRVAGGRADYLDLPMAGHPGNSHMMMMDRSSDQIAAIVMQWITSPGSLSATESAEVTR